MDTSGRAASPFTRAAAAAVKVVSAPRELFIAAALDFLSAACRARDNLALVPQADIIHAELTVRETLAFAAALRLSLWRSVSGKAAWMALARSICLPIDPMSIFRMRETFSSYERVRGVAIVLSSHGREPSTHGVRHSA